jgi:hypothetical protein
MGIFCGPRLLALRMGRAYDSELCFWRFFRLRAGPEGALRTRTRASDVDFRYTQDRRRLGGRMPPQRIGAQPGLAVR